MSMLLTVFIDGIEQSRLAGELSLHHISGGPGTFHADVVVNRQSRPSTNAACCRGGVYLGYGERLYKHCWRSVALFENVRSHGSVYIALLRSYLLLVNVAWASRTLLPPLSSAMRSADLRSAMSSVEWSSVELLPLGT